MRLTMLTFAVGFVSVMPEPVISGELPEHVLAVQDRFGYLLNELTIKRNTEIERLNSIYEEKLVALEAEARSEGDLDGVVALRAEIERFRDTEQVSREEIQSEPSGLGNLQQIYLAAIVSGRVLEIDEQIVHLSDRYIRGLEEQKRNMVHADDIPTAKALRNEIERVQNNSRRIRALDTQQAAQALLAESGTETAGDPQDDPVWEDGVYPLGDEPSFSGSEKNLRHTAHSRAVAHFGHLTLLVREESSDVRDRRSGYYHGGRWRRYNVQYGEFQYYPRVVFRPSPREDIRLGSAVFQYYADPLASSESLKLVRTEIIPLPRTLNSAQGVVVDGGGVGYTMSEWRPRGSGRSRGHRHAGIVVSIYDVNGDLVAQRADGLAFIDHGEISLPDPLNDQRGAVFRLELYDTPRGAEPGTTD